MGSAGGYSRITHGGFGFEFNQEIQNDLAETIIQLVAAFGALIALYGRLNATRIIG